jgi:hypothetical protein
MPGCLWTLIIIFAIVVFIVPDPAGAGAALGNAIDSIIIFFQSMVTAATT